MSTHVGIAFATQCPKEVSTWEYSSNSLVILSVRDEFELLLLKKEFQENQIKVIGFYEPDYNNELMSIAMLLDVNEAKKLKNKNLLLKGTK